MKHAVALLPGFLGFRRFGTFTYFARRFIKGLERGLNVEVLPLTTLPIGSLADRQDTLIHLLTSRHSGEPTCWHLVGHSAGGVDAALAARSQRLRNSAAQGVSCFKRDDLKAVPGVPVLPNLGSVTTISSPHYGTSIVRSPLLILSRTGHWTYDAAEEALKAALAVMQPQGLVDRIRFFLGALKSGGPGFLKQLLSSDQLANDLDIANVAALTADTSNLTDVPIYCVATVAPIPSRGRGTSGELVYEVAWDWVKDGLKLVKPEDVAAPALPGGSPAVIGSALLPTGAFQPGDCDGVVNTARQFAPRCEFRALVGADHADVLGDPDLMASGAGFDDAKFAWLMRVIVQCVADGIARADPPVQPREAKRAAGG